MTQKQMIELVQQHHPTANPNVIRLWLNQRLNEFAERASLNRDYVEITSVAGTAKYSLPASIIDIMRVDYDGVRIARRPGEPPVIEETVAVVEEEVGP